MNERLSAILEEDSKHKTVVKTTVELDSQFLPQIIAEITKPRSHFEQMSIYLRSAGYIGISGCYKLPNGEGHVTYGDVARLVEGSRIGKPYSHLFLQIYVYPIADLTEEIKPTIDLVQLLRKFQPSKINFAGISMD